MAKSLERTAREYIDAAIKKQRRLGYKGDVPKDSYDRAVKQAERAFGELQESRRIA